MRPIKGTISRPPLCVEVMGEEDKGIGQGVDRGRWVDEEWAREDERRKNVLKGNEKDQAENLMVSEPTTHTLSF